MLVHPAKSVKATSGWEHPQAVTEHPSLCRGPSQEHCRVLHPRSSSRQHSSIRHQSPGPLVPCGTHPSQHAHGIHSGARSDGIDTALSKSGTQVRN
jgi:hypothetical protein